jgi:hypothetical protein
MITNIRVIEVAYRDENGTLKTKDVLQFFSEYVQPTPGLGSGLGSGTYGGGGRSGNWVDVPRLSLEDLEKSLRS